MTLLTFVYITLYENMIPCLQVIEIKMVCFVCLFFDNLDNFFWFCFLDFLVYQLHLLFGNDQAYEKENMIAGNRQVLLQC